MITLHQYHMSPFNMKIQRMLNHKGVPFGEKYWGLTDSKSVKQINPSNKLPALEHNGAIVCDSTDMAWYIEEQFPDKPLIPSEPRLRGLMHALEDWADESLYFYEMHLRFGTPGNQQRNLPRMVANESGLVRWFLLKVIPRALAKTTATQGVGRKSLDRVLRDTRRHIEAINDLVTDDAWLLGGQMSLADLAVHTMFSCFREASEANAMIEEYPQVIEWMARVAAATNARAQL